MWRAVWLIFPENVVSALIKNSFSNLSFIAGKSKEDLSASHFLDKKNGLSFLHGELSDELILSKKADFS